MAPTTAFKNDYPTRKKGERPGERRDISLKLCAG